MIIDLELLEINRTRNKELGLDLSSKSLSLVFGEGSDSLTLNSLDSLKSQAAWSIGPIPSVVMKFLKSDSDAKTISRPQLRILEGEDGKITIGDRVPIPATTFNSSQTVGGNIVPITSFTYQNVGIIVDIKPRVHHNKEVTLELKLEISSLAGSVEGSGGVSQPIIGTRTIETTIRLKDGETNLLAGLIKEEERTSLAGIPGLSDIPFLRRVFGSTKDEATVTDIVMSVTPHILRIPNIEPIDLVPLWVGTEESIKLRGVARNALGESPFAGEYAPWDEIQETLAGEEETGAAEGKPSQVDIKGEPSTREDEPSRAREPQQQTERQRRPRRRPTAPDEPTPLGEEKSFGGEGAPVQEPPSAEAETPSDEPEPEKEEEPRRVSVAQVRLVAPGQAAPGAAIPVQVLVSGADDVGMINFQLRYDPAVVSFVPNAQLGPFLQQGGIPADLQAMETAEPGLIVVSGARAGEQGASGSGVLVRLNFVAVAQGNAGFAFSAAQVRSPSAQALPANFRVSSVQVIP